MDIMTLANRIESTRQYIKCLQSDIENPDRVQRDIERMEAQVYVMLERIEQKRNQLQRSKDLLIDACNRLARLQKQYDTYAVKEKDMRRLQRLHKELKRNRRFMQILKEMEDEDNENGDSE